MGRTSKTAFLVCIVHLTLSGCAYNCICDEGVSRRTESPISRLIPEGQQLLNECKYIDEGIIDSKSFSKKMSNSRYAIYYQAMSREKISALQKRAKEIGCP